MDGTHPRAPSLPRRFVSGFVPAICLLLIVHVYALQPFQVPTGSMAPTLLGNHRAVDCPRCGFRVVVGRTQSDKLGQGCQRCYAKAACPNCGCGSLPLGPVEQTSGDHVLVAKNVYSWRRPRRWEVAVFRLLGKIFIKRIIGLPGEEITIVDGDIYINGELARKSYDQAKAMRVLVFDNDFAPGPGGWRERWESLGGTTLQYIVCESRVKESTSALAAGERLNELMLDGRVVPHQLTYCHFSLDEQKCQPIVDEYAYNAGCQAAPEAVHDFLVECDVLVVQGKGSVVFGLTDGGEQVEVEVPVAREEECKVRTGPSSMALLKNAPPMQLFAGNHYHIEMALVDRRLSFRVDGRDAFDPVDFPEAGPREKVMRPLWLKTAGTQVRLRNLRLHRDLHYSQAGHNAVRGAGVRLGASQVFVLGDNSQNSEDSRFWPEQGAVPLEALVGRAILIHLPSRMVVPQIGTGAWRFQLPDWQRLGWIK